MSRIYAPVTSGAFHSRSQFADGTDGWEVAYHVITRGRQDVPALVSVIEKAVERAEDLPHEEPNLVIWHIPDGGGCMRIRYGVQYAVGTVFSVPSDSTEFGAEREPLAGGVPVYSRAQVPQDTRDRMFDFVPGYCIAHN